MKLTGTYFLTLAFCLLGVEALAQPASTTWALTTTSLLTSTSTGSVTGANEVIGGGSPAMTVWDYTAMGQRLYMGTAGWVAGPEDPARYIQFNTAPNTGVSFTVNSVSFEYGASVRAASMASNVWYSTDGWTTRTQLNASLTYQAASMSVFSANPNATVAPGATFSLRIYPYALLSQVGGSPQFAVHNTVRIAGTTQVVLPQTGPFCTTFTGGATGGWVGQNTLTAVLTETSGNQYIQTTDQSGPSFFYNQSAAYTGNWGGLFAGGCGSLCFDVKYIDNGGGPLNVTPSITIEGGGFVASFISATSIAVGDPWRTICAPLKYLNSDGTMPSNASGHWVMNTGTPANWSTLLSNVTRVRLPTDPSSYQAEKFGFDNICIKDTGDCNPPPVVGSVCGMKYNDVNGDGDRDTGEPGIPGWQINLTGAATMSATTDSTGTYCFRDLQQGNYTVAEVNQTGWHQTAPGAPGTHPVIISATPSVTLYNFGNQLNPILECVNPPAGLVGWWPGDNHANDITSLHNNGNLLGAAYGPGKVGNAFSFSSSADYVAVGNNAALNFATGALSLDAWVKTSDAASTMYIVDKRGGTAANPVGYSFFIQAGKLAFQLGDGSAALDHVSTSPSISDGNWHFVAVTIARGSATGGKLYLDGTLIHTFSTVAKPGSITNTSPLLIGQRSFSPLTTFRGMIDEVEVFNRVVAKSTLDSIFAVAGLGKCKKPGDPDCAEPKPQLPINTGLNHAVGSPYAVGGNDAFWMITADADTSRTVPRPADVVTHLTGIWNPAQPNSQWIGPSQLEPDTNPLGLEQDDIGIGLYTYALEICIIGQTADRLDFNLSLLSDNTAKVWLRMPNGTRHLTMIGQTSGNGFSAATAIINSLNGPFPPGTYVLEVDVTNNGISPDFTGMNLTGTIAGANLFLQKHECCNSSGKITGKKFSDLNGNGQKNTGEPGIGGVTIQLVQGGIVVAQTMTDSAGDYFFDVTPGTYTVREIVPVGYTQTGPTGGTYTVTVGPGGIVPNRDFGNQVIPCIGAGAAWLCKATGGARYLQLTVTNNGAIPVSHISATSLTPGVTFTLFNTVTYPVNQGGSAIMNFNVTGLAPGASAQIQISMHGPPNAAGLSEECCTDTLTVVRPGGPGIILQYCPPKWIDGYVLDAVTGTGRPPMTEWVVRMRDQAGRSTTTMTDAAGYFLMEGLPLGTYTASVDLPFGWRVVEPSAGFYPFAFREAGPGVSGVRFVVTDQVGSGLGEGATGLPTEYALQANHPNPFHASTRIRYALPQEGAVLLEVFDMLGRRVATLVDGVQPPGRYEADFDASRLGSGVYLYVMKAGAFVETRRMLVAK